MKKIFSFFAAMLVVFAANAKVWNVGPGHNEESDRTDCNLYVTLDRLAQAGDTILLADGEYIETLSMYVKGAAVIMAAEGANPVLKQSSYFKLEADAKFIGIKFEHVAESNGYCMYFQPGCSRLELQDCEITGFKETCIMSWDEYACNNLIINNCYIHDNVKSAIYDPSGYIANTVITNSTFANNDVSPWSAGLIDIRKGASGDPKLTVDHCTFYHNLLTNSDYGEIRPRGLTGVLVSNCIFAQPEDYERVATRFSDNNGNGEVRNVITHHYTKRTNQWGHYDGATYTACSMGDPLFVDAANANFTLGEGSPALNYAGKDENGADVVVNLGDPRWWPAAALEAPDAAPAAPEWPANQVKAVYSATYNADCGFGEWGSGTVYTQEEFGKKFVTTSLGYFGLLFEGDNALNCSMMEKLHLDVWIAEDASIGIVPIHGAAEKRVTKNLVGQQWNSIDIALTEFEGVENWSNVYQIKIDEARELTFWVNNVFFYTTVAPAEDEVAPTDFTAVADEASYFSAKIKAKATDNSGAVEFDVINGELIVATVKAASEAEAIITVKNLTPNTEYNFSVVAKDESGNAAEPIAVATKTLEAPAAAPAPVIDAAKVKSIYSDAYEFAPASLNSYNEDWWNKPDMFEGELAEGDKALFYAKVAEGMIGWQFGEIDVTDFPFLHIDIYPLADGSIMIYPVDNIEPKQEYKETYEVKGGKWNNLVIDMSGKDLTKIFQIGWINYVALNGFFIDNVFYSSENTVPEVGTAIDNTAAAVKAQKVIMNGQLFIIRDGQMFNAQGQLQ